MSRRQWLTGLALVAAGALAGAAAIIVSTEVNRRTATDEFCTSCHSMASVAADPHYKQSAHESNAAGFRTGCADCHMAPGNWFAETFTHARLGIKDTLAEYTHDYSDAAAWQKRRQELRAKVDDELRRSDSATCRRCHDVSAIKSGSGASRAAHALLRPGSRTCIDCHANLVHAP
jgi:trimethylamine-N-oxide reductase cytochrome c-type subunit TorC